MTADTSWNAYLAALPCASPLAFPLESLPCCALDLSARNPALRGFDPGITPDFIAFIGQQIAAADARFAAGGYGENRTLYAMSPVFSPPGDSTEPRTLHLGVDLWLEAGSSVHAVLPGRVHSCQDNAAFGDYGPTILLEHALDGCLFYTLYGHLARESLAASPVGRAVNAGDLLGWLGTPEVNVGWPPHLHFQIITDLLGYSGDYPGVCKPSEAEQWLARCPDPNLLLRIPALAGHVQGPVFV
jgi:murein DD-endopeptidase MepM/ murein hydrolase activator NlpD